MGMREDIMQALGITQPDIMSANEQRAYQEATGSPINGFHVNLAIGKLPEALIPFSVMPDHPTRVFA